MGYPGSTLDSRRLSQRFTMTKYEYLVADEKAIKELIHNNEG